MDAQAVSSTRVAPAGTGGRLVAATVLGLVSTVLLGVGVVVAAQGVTTAATPTRSWTVIAGVAALGAVLAGTGVVRRSPCWAARLLGAGLALTLVISAVEETPPLAAPTLVVTLVLVLSPATTPTAGVTHPAARSALSAASLALMLPVGFYYLGIGLLVPATAASVAHVAYLLLLAWTLRRSLRRSLWVAAGPAVASGLWLAVVTAGERLLGWTA